MPCAPTASEAGSERGLWEPHDRASGRLAASTLKSPCPILTRSAPGRSPEGVTGSARSTSARCVLFRSVAGLRLAVDADRKVVGIQCGTFLGNLLRRQTLADPIINFRHELRILGEERLDVLSTLTQLLTLIREPRTGLLDEAELDRDVQ